MISTALLHKYNQPVPRYTSYPTVPYWKENIDAAQWKNNFVKAALDNTDGISLYIHLPFCESLCTYCGCNKKITTNHSVEIEYMQAIVKEWKLYKALMPVKPVLRELHLGGGTPTFFSPTHLEELLTAILDDCDIHPNHEFSFEGHPNNTTYDHLQTLFNIGFRRVSFGVQDHDAKVQHIINRIQPFENVKRGVENARAIGYTSVNFDLIYGLPLQTLESIEKTILQSIELKPDRIAFYSYAHVPWTSKAQRLFDEHDLPSAELKMQLYLSGKQLFTQAGYSDIGMDHFALPTDDLFVARQEGWLHRNFMGYTTQKTSMLLGLGVSSISDIGIAYAQNRKTLHEYYSDIVAGELAVTKGYFLSEEDTRFKRYILDISCLGKTTFQEEDEATLRSFSYPELLKLSADNLIEWNDEGVTVTATGKQFIRNICKAFDIHLLKSQQEPARKFSMAI